MENKHSNRHGAVNNGVHVSDALLARLQDTVLADTGYVYLGSQSGRLKGKGTPPTTFVKVVDDPQPNHAVHDYTPYAYRVLCPSHLAHVAKQEKQSVSLLQPRVSASDGSMCVAIPEWIKSMTTNEREFLDAAMLMQGPAEKRIPLWLLMLACEVSSEAKKEMAKHEPTLVSRLVHDILGRRLKHIGKESLVDHCMGMDIAYLTVCLEDDEYCRPISNVYHDELVEYSDKQAKYVSRCILGELQQHYMSGTGGESASADGDTIIEHGKEGFVYLAYDSKWDAVRSVLSEGYKNLGGKSYQPVWLCYAFGGHSYTLLKDIAERQFLSTRDCAEGIMNLALEEEHGLDKQSMGTDNYRLISHTFDGDQIPLTDMPHGFRSWLSRILKNYYNMLTLVHNSLVDEDVHMSKTYPVYIGEEGTAMLKLLKEGYDSLHANGLPVAMWRCFAESGKWLDKMQSLAEYASVPKSHILQATYNMAIANMERTGDYTNVDIRGKLSCVSYCGGDMPTTVDAKYNLFMDNFLGYLYRAACELYDDEDGFAASILKQAEIDIQQGEGDVQEYLSSSIQLPDVDDMWRIADALALITDLLGYKSNPLWLCIMLSKLDTDQLSDLHIVEKGKLAYTLRKSMRTFIKSADGGTHQRQAVKWLEDICMNADAELVSKTEGYEYHKFMSYIGRFSEYAVKNVRRLLQEEATYIEEVTVREGKPKTDIRNAAKQAKLVSAYGMGKKRLHECVPIVLSEVSKGEVHPVLLELLSMNNRDNLYEGWLYSWLLRSKDAQNLYAEGEEVELMRDALRACRYLYCRERERQGDDFTATATYLESWVLNKDGYTLAFPTNTALSMSNTMKHNDQFSDYLYCNFMKVFKDIKAARNTHDDIVQAQQDIREATEDELDELIGNRTPSNLIRSRELTPEEAKALEGGSPYAALDELESNRFGWWLSVPKWFKYSLVTILALLVVIGSISLASLATGVGTAYDLWHLLTK